MKGPSAGAAVQLGGIYSSELSPVCGMGPREVEEEGQAAKLTQTLSHSGSSPPSSHLPSGDPLLPPFSAPAPRCTPERPGLYTPHFLRSEAIDPFPGGPAQQDTGWELRTSRQEEALGREESRLILGAPETLRTGVQPAPSSGRCTASADALRRPADMQITCGAAGQISACYF